MKTIINRAACKKYTEELTAEYCPNVTQISPFFLDKINNGAKLLIKDLILNFNKEKPKQKTLR
jgi:hypothetical protein